MSALRLGAKGTITPETAKLFIMAWSLSSRELGSDLRLHGSTNEATSQTVVLVCCSSPAPR
jgi:hypothetical protein